MFTAAFLGLLEPLRSVFRQDRTFSRLTGFLVSLLCAAGRHTLTAALPAGFDHAAFYRLFSRARWEVEPAFGAVWEGALPLLGKARFLAVALDDTLMRKTGRMGGLARRLWDGTSPRFLPVLVRGLRWLHAALLVRVEGHSALALTVGFELAQPLRRPKRNAPPEEHAAFRKAAKPHSLPMKGARMAGVLRKALDDRGLEATTLLMVVDGGYMNRSFLQNQPGRTCVIGRVRRDMRLCHPAPAGGRKVYGEQAATPDEVRTDDRLPWKETHCIYGGQERTLRYKEVAPLLWRTGSKRKLQRLVILAPIPYHIPGRPRRGYREPAFLLTDDLESPIEALIQAYLDRWQIEVVHRELKQDAGIGQPQVWNPQSIQRLAPMLTILWALLRLAAHNTYGTSRDPHVWGELPPYRRRNPPRRPSPQDLLRKLRSEKSAQTALAA